MLSKGDDLIKLIIHLTCPQFPVVLGMWINAVRFMLNNSDISFNIINHYLQKVFFSNDTDIA